LFFLGQPKGVDVGILIGASPTTTPERWTALLQFASRIASTFKVAPRDAHFGVIAFGATPKVHLRFDSFTGHQLNYQNVKKTIEAIPYKSITSTRIDKALELAASYLFREGNGMRDSVPKVSDFLILVWK